MVVILLIVIVGFIVIVIMLNVLCMVGVVMGEVVGCVGFLVKYIDVSGIDWMDWMSVYVVVFD